MRRLLHLIADLAVLFLILGLPMLCTDTGRAVLRGQPDAVSGASVIAAQPSGNYVVLLNTDRHPDKGNLALWEQFFTGDEAPVIFEDISCLTAVSDRGGRDMAESCRSRLPENQMTVQAIDSTLLLSKAEYGLFDCIILSQEAADAGGASALSTHPEILFLYVSDKGAST
ncbi:MAG: hypothetical protein IJ060_08470 [Oscillospiraceae bacterium]|nr:hypothetical protein [Oscillospiraceae bacterium]